MALRSVNHRSLELKIKLHESLYPLEGGIRACVREKAIRGKLDLVIEVQDEPALEPKINRCLLRNLAHAWQEETEELQLPPMSPEAFFRMPGAFSAASDSLAERLEKPIMESLHSLLEIWNQARESEASRLSPFFENAVLQLMKTHTQMSADAEQNMAGLPNQYLQRLESIMKEAGLKGQLPEERLIAEASVLAEKQGIQEELERLKSHLDDIEERIRLGCAAGKELDIWCQEVLRELNTIGSKSRRLNMTRAVMGAKGILEQIREQAANLE